LFSPVVPVVPDLLLALSEAEALEVSEELLLSPEAAVPVSPAFVDSAPSLFAAWPFSAPDPLA
jgi:hypothetical protein